MEKHASTLFLEIYRKRFGATYDATQESTWRWLTAQYISDFYAPAYTRGNPPDTCLTLREGHRPKMFLWMLEEFAFILCHLRKDDQDGAMVLGHELLLLAHSRCHRKRGSRHPGCYPTGQAAYLLVPNPGACHVCTRYNPAGAISLGSVQ